MNASEFLQGVVANWIRGIAAPAAPTSLQVALSLTDPTMTGAGLSEPTGAGYARQTVTFSAPTFNDVDGTQTSNTNDLTFLSSGAATHMAVFSDSGDMLFFGALQQARTVPDGDTHVIQAGKILVRIGGIVSHYLGGQIVNWIRGTAFAAAPAATFIGLSKTTVVPSGMGLTEPASTHGHDRQVITFGAPVFTAGVGSVLANDQLVLLGPSYTMSWGTIRGVAIHDAEEDGNMLLYGNLSAPRVNTLGNGEGISEQGISFTLR